MDISTLQVILIILLGFFINLDRFGLHLNIWQPVVIGGLAGFILGDIKSGLFIGGSLQLMILGIGSFGGAAIPDYATASLVGTYVAIYTGQPAQIGTMIGIPVAIMMVHLDVIKSTVNIWFLHKSETALKENKDYKFRIELNHWLGGLLTMAVTGIPVTLAVLIGPDFVKLLIEHTPQWIMGSMNVAGGLLPVIGVGLLLCYLPTKEYFPCLIVGFFLAAYLKIPILGIAVLGVAWGLIVYKNLNKNIESVKPQKVGNDE